MTKRQGQLNYLLLIPSIRRKDFLRTGAVLVLASWLCSAQGACPSGASNCSPAAEPSDVVRQATYWRSALSKPFDARFGPAPPELVAYLTRDNIENGFPERPSAAVIPADFRRDLDHAVAELPPFIKHALKDRLAGVYFVNGLGSSGFTDRIVDAAGRPVGAWIVLDLGVLSQRSANVWATWKENTPFKPDGVNTLTATIETPANDNRKNAIQYILLHEMGHALSVGRDITPGWWMPPFNPSPVKYPFFTVSWRLEGEEYAPRAEDDFPSRSKVVYYLGPRFGTDQSVPVYGELAKTNFPTLYASTNPYDDFAESFASYVHTMIMHKPFEIRFLKNGREVDSFKICWTDPRCALKRAQLEHVLADVRR